MSTRPPLFLGLDIETLPGLIMPTKDELVPPKTMKKPETILAWKNDPANLEKEHRKQSLDSLKGRIFIIGFAFDNEDIKVLYNENERELLDALADEITTRHANHSLVWYGHNIKGFDLPFLFHRALLTQSKLLHLIPKSVRDKRVMDTATMFGMEQYGKYYKLSDIAKFLGIEGKYGDIDGSMVFDLWKENRVEDLKKYCGDDVRITRDIFYRLNDTISVLDA